VARVTEEREDSLPICVFCEQHGDFMIVRGVEDGLPKDTPLSVGLKSGGSKTTLTAS